MVPSLIIGGGLIRTFGRITLPLIPHGIIAGAIVSFIISHDDVNIALFLPESTSRPFRNYRQQKR